MSGAAWGAGAQAASSAFGAHLSYNSAEQNRDQAARFAKNRYRYAVKDMKAAGLNPILAAGGVAGGASPNTSMPNTDLSGVGQAIATAFQLKKVKQETATGEASEKLLIEQAKKAIEDSKVSAEQVKKLEAEIRSINQNIKIKKPTETVMRGANTVLSDVVGGAEKAYHSAKDALKPGTTKNWSKSKSKRKSRSNAGRK